MLCDEDDSMDGMTMQGVVGIPGYNIGTFLLETLRDHLNHDISVRPVLSNPDGMTNSKRIADVRITHLIF